MLRWLILKKIASEERTLGESIDYARHILRTSLGAFLRFGMFTPMAQYRKKLPVVPHAVAGIVSSRHADCGTCVQIGVNVAKKSGVPGDVLRAVIDRRPDDLPPDAALAYRFAEAVLASSGEEDGLREQVRTRFGERGLVELSLAIASAHVFPLVKRALGYATSCSRVEVRV